MKKAVFILCLSFSIVLFLFVAWPLYTVNFSESTIVSNDEFDILVSKRTEIPFLSLLDLTADGEQLPHDEKTGRWYSPAIRGIKAKLPAGFRLVRTAYTENPSDGDVCRLLVYNNIFYKEYRLIETNLPVISIQLSRFDLKPHNIPRSRTGASIKILALAENGNLQSQTDRIEIKARGDSSLAYDKRSYTIFMSDADRPNPVQSMVGLPADRKYALNSMYEDGSKIRDALASHIWAQMEPTHAPQYTYAELIIDNGYLGLYGVQQIITETALCASQNDIIYKINDHCMTDTSTYTGILPEYELSYGNDPDAVMLKRFFAPLQTQLEAFPTCYDLDSFIHYALQMEIISCADNELKNMAITYLADREQFRLTGWDMDISFGLIWYIDYHLNIKQIPSMAEYRFLSEDDQYFRPLTMLYNTCPAFAEAVAARYRELRETVFTDEALLQKARSLYDPLTACGARQRDAERWPNSAISEDNSFIETFIPARMAFLDGVFQSND